MIPFNIILVVNYSYLLLYLFLFYFSKIFFLVLMYIYDLNVLIYYDYWEVAGTLSHNFPINKFTDNDYVASVVETYCRSGAILKMISRKFLCWKILLLLSLYVRFFLDLKIYNIIYFYYFMISDNSVSTSTSTGTHTTEDNVTLSTMTENDNNTNIS